MEDLKKAGTTINEELQRHLYSKFFKDFFTLNKAREKEFEPELADMLVEKYTQDFDLHKSNNDRFGGPLNIPLERKKAFINQSAGA